MPNLTPIVGAIADDFTGATDLATMLVARGFRTQVTVGPPAPGPTGGNLLDGAPHPEEDTGTDAIVVALKSRTAPVRTAVEDSVAALRALRAAGCERFYFKYCSTFDSTPRGNIGPVIDALLDELGERRTVVVPSFPATGRTVYRSRLFVHDDLLSESPMRDHPLTPMRDSHLERLLAPQTRHAVHALPHETVRAGTDAVRKALAAPALQDGLIVMDATTDDDLRTLAAATDSLPLVTGAAGLALGLTGPRPDTASAHARAADATPTARGAVLSGSASATTRAQVAHGKERLPHRKLDLAALRADFEAAITSLTAFVTDCWDADPTKPPLIYAVADAADVERAAPREDAAPARDEAAPPREVADVPRGASDVPRGDAAAPRGDADAQETGTSGDVRGGTAGDHGGRGEPADTAGAAGDAASVLVERALARLATALVDAGATGLLVAGGETSGAVTTALGVRTLRMGAPLAPGVSWATARARTGTRRAARTDTRTDARTGEEGEETAEGSRDIDLALKSGNFGATDLFTSAWKALV